MSRFYFAWVDSTDSTFTDSFKREDEQVFSVNIQHNEGDFPSMDIDLVNPRVGLLSAGRKQWAWLAWEDDSNVVHPLFFGRLLGVPQSMQANVVRLTFIARPLDYDAQRASIQATEAASSPVYDAVWLSQDDLTNPDSVLETKPSLWHIDRTTLVVSTTDIIEGEDGTVNFTESDVFRDSLDTHYSESPATKCVVTATVNWTQRGSGSFPIHKEIVDAFVAGNVTKGLQSARGNPVSGNGMIAVIPGKDLLDKWPKAGTSFGGGWSVTQSSLTTIGPPPLDPILVPYYNHWLNLQQLLAGDNFQATALRNIFERSPGFTAQVIPSWLAETPFGLAHGDIDIIWFPIWLLAPTMYVGWDVARPRQEVVSFTLEADVQPLLADPGADDTIQITLGPVDVDTAITHLTSPRYFGTDRGKRSFQSLIARARAALLARARAVEVEFDVPFDKVISLSCRMNGTVSDDRLPGGVAGGKIKGYTISADGDSGTLIGHVVLGCTVGHDGSITEDAGTPDYCDADYVIDYQNYSGQTLHIPGYDDLTYSLGDYSIDDDGVVLTSVLKNEYLQGITVTGTIDEQRETLDNSTSPVASAAEVIAKVSGFETTVSISMKPISDNSFLTNITPTLSALKIPKTIDTESI